LISTASAANRRADRLLCRPGRQNDRAPGRFRRYAGRLCVPLLFWWAGTRRAEIPNIGSAPSSAGSAKMDNVKSVPRLISRSNAGCCPRSASCYASLPSAMPAIWDHARSLGWA
jgi:hypothetical protein